MSPYIPCPHVTENSHSSDVTLVEQSEIKEGMGGKKTSSTKQKFTALSQG